jgi:hypothetical protein
MNALGLFGAFGTLFAAGYGLLALLRSSFLAV